MTEENRRPPAVLEVAHSLGWFSDHDGHDFQPDDMFESSGETAEWWQMWTGNPAAGVALINRYRAFG